ncbi:MAG: methyl-accepting chemotaxis protein [Myxococcota bacterium]
MTLRRLIPATVIATTAIAVALACFALSTYQAREAREALVAELEGLGEILSTQAVMALAEGNAAPAEIMLLSLGARSDIEAAAVYDARGAPFAQYLRDYDAGVAIPDRPGAAGTRFAAGFVEHVRNVERGDQRVGTFYLRASTQRLSDVLTASLLIGALVFLLSIVPGLLASYRLVRSIARPLAALAEAAQRTASGDLRAELEVTRAGGEIGALTQAFGDMTAKLRGTVADIVAGSSAVTEAAAGLREASERTAAHSERQESSVESMSSALQGVNQSVGETTAQLDALTAVAEQVSSSGLEMQAVTRSVGDAARQLVLAIEQNAGAAREAAAATGQISEIASALDGSAERSGASVERLGLAIDALRERALRGSERAAAAAAASREGADSARLTAGAVDGVRGAHDALAATVAELAEKSTAIQGVLGIVEDVVDETRLLALNAGILAAQAGQHGKAFSVVANQIGALAGRTASSTGTIASHLAELRKGIAAAVAGNAEIGARIREGTTQAAHSDGAFARLLETAGEFAAESREISELAEGQTAALEQVRPAFARVRSLAAEIEAAIRSQGGAAEAIAKRMEDARLLGTEVNASVKRHGESGQNVAAAVVDLRERMEDAKAVSAVQLAAAGSIRKELLDLASGTQDGVSLATDMRDLVNSLAVRAQGLARSAARFRLPERKDGERGRAEASERSG